MASKWLPAGGVRRSGRITRRLQVVLEWRDAQEQWADTPAETRLLSRFGCLLTCRARLHPGKQVVFWWPVGRREARAQVVCRVVQTANDLVELALEFLDNDNFWEIEFPADVTRGQWT